MTFHVYCPDRGEELEDARVYTAHDAENAAEEYAERLHERDFEASWPIELRVHCPEMKSTVTVSVDREWRPSFGATVLKEPRPCAHLTTDSDSVWTYGTPDSSGWERECKVCGAKQQGSIPLP